MADLLQLQLVLLPLPWEAWVASLAAACRHLPAAGVQPWAWVLLLGPTLVRGPPMGR